ncbi:MAG: hypothetical protein WA782_14825 [Sulfitobacter sp.]
MTTFNKLLRTFMALPILVLAMATGAAQAESVPLEAAKVIEIVTFTLKDDTTVPDFAKLDAAVQEQHVANQPGFVARHSAAGTDGAWLVVVYWDSVGAADASMASFMDAAAAADFVAALDADTMTMTRYSVPE